MENFLLSCIVPFRDYIVLCDNLLKSLGNFTERVEVVLVHDTKSSLENAQIDFLKAMQADVKYVWGDYKSAAKARNQGIANASGEWIIFWDSDDYGYTDECLDVIKGAGSYEVLICGFKVTESKLGKVNHFLPGRPGLRQVVLTPGIWRHIFRRKLIAETLFHDIPLGEDILFLIECGAYENQILFSETVVYEYRLSEYQSTRNMNLTIELKRFLDKLTQVLHLQQPISVVPYGIYIRQTLALIARSKGKGLTRYFGITLTLYRGLSEQSKSSFRKAIVLALVKKRIKK